MKGIANLSCIPMRNEPSDRAEMTNQVLFGETFDILETIEKWSKIRLHHDKYEGWIDNKQYQLIENKKAKNTKHNLLPVPYIKKNKQLYFLGSYVDFDVAETKKNILQTALSFLNTPYLWGGRTIAGIDCSGFTQIVFRAHHISLLRDAYQQQTQGKKIKWMDAQTNDLAFFQNDAGKITHVGIVIKEKNGLKIIHASGKVRIDKLDETGIFKEEINAYSHQLHSIKRIQK